MFRRFRAPARWTEIEGWFQWRSGQKEAVRHFEDGSRFVEVGNYLGRSLCSLGELVRQSGKHLPVIGIDTCRGSGIEGLKQKDYHAAAVRKGGGTFAGTLHRNVISCGLADTVSLIVSDSITAASFFADRSIAWVHLDAAHDRQRLIADIAAWRPKIAGGGWLSGDDYDDVKWPDVIATINETLPAAKPWSVRQWRLLVE
jgi:Methyltransferase domain